MSKQSNSATKYRRKPAGNSRIVKVRDIDYSVALDNSDDVFDAVQEIRMCGCLGAGSLAQAMEYGCA